MKIKNLLVGFITLVGIITTGCAVGAKSVSEESLGLRKTDLYTEQANTVGDTVSYGKAVAGESKKIERAFENAPPMISHSVEGMLPIKVGNNACLGCHLPEVAKDVKATPMPKTHFMDFRTQKPLGHLAQQRFNCSQCHVPQSNNKPLVENTFSPDFRTGIESKSANLIDNLNEGVR